MRVYLNRVDGIDDAILTMFYSRRHITREFEMHVREVVHDCSNNRISPDCPYGALVSKNEELEKWLDQLFKFSEHHITMGKFIDLSFTVYGLHRAGQDDWDAHAKRYDNRIIRESTRLGVFGNEMSDWYKGKIIPTDIALAALGITVPDEITYEGEVYVKTTNGYIIKGHENDKDYKRGLYMLSIPSNFIFRCNLTEFGHVYKERNDDGTANGEVKLCCESCADQVDAATLGYANREWLAAVKN